MIGLFLAVCTGVMVSRACRLEGGMNKLPVAVEDTVKAGG